MVNVVMSSLIDPCLDHVLHAQQVHLWMGNWIARSLLSCRVQILLRSLKKLHWICRTEVQQVSSVFVARDIVEGGYCWICLNLSSSYFSLHVHWICLAIALRVWSAAKTDVWLGIQKDDCLQYLIPDMLQIGNSTSVWTESLSRDNRDVMLTSKSIFSFWLEG